MKYNFDEKTEEYHAAQRKKLPVWQSPKYKSSKEKAIELIESKKYGLDESDFWILMNSTKSGKMMYTGLIISHNGCLKINSALEENLQFKPSCVEMVRDDGEKSKVMKYVSDDQGVFEFGEISPNNCKNDYPYAMVLKRLMDRVILKNSKVGFFGIYSDSEMEDFKYSGSGDDSGSQNHSKSVSVVKTEITNSQKKPLYPDAKFKENFGAWVEAISSGKKDASSIINAIESSFILVKAQRDAILNIKIISDPAAQSENFNAIHGC